MFIPYELGQEVYVFNQATIADLIKTKIISVTVDKNEGVMVIVDQKDIPFSNCFRIEKVYPCKSIAKQALLEMSFGRISKALED